MQKLLAVIALPIITLLIFSVNHIDDKFSILTENELELINLNMMKNTSNLIHELQLERGLSSSYLNGINEKYFLDKLQLQKKQTNKQIKLFFNSITDTHANVSLTSKKYIDDLLPSIKMINNFRKQIVLQKISRKESFNYYTILNKQLISIIGTFNIHIFSKQTNLYLSALHHIILFQEFAGQERAFVSKLKESDRLLNYDIRQYYNIIEAQKDLDSKIDFLLESNQLANKLENIYSKYEQNFFQKTRDTVIKKIKNNNNLKIDIKRWFNISTDRINEIHHIEKQLFQTILKAIQDDILKAHNSLRNQIILTFTTILLLLIGTFYISYKIKYAITQLETGINDFFNFLNFKGEKPKDIQTDTNDELNDIAKSINYQMIKIDENLKFDKEYIQEITKIVTLMKDGNFSQKTYTVPHNPSLEELKLVFDELIELISDKIKEQTKSLEILNLSLEERVHTQTLELEEQIKEITISRDKAIKAEIAKDEFLANMSHEIRTPLNAILGFVTILKKRISEKKSLNYLNIIDTSGKSLLTIINDILDFSKIQSGKFTITPYHFNPVEELSNTALLFASKAYEKNIFYYVYIDPNLPKTISVDIVRIKQIFSNLLSNAIKFTPEDGEIKVCVTCEESKLIISVEDTGIGISSKNQVKVFSAFEQADGSTTRKYGGTGLGLSISSKLAKLMNGELSLKSEEGKGSIFTMDIPIEIIDVTPNKFIDEEKIKKIKFAILNHKDFSKSSLELIDRYLKEFGVKEILYMEEFKANLDYDVLFFTPEDEYNEEIINSKKPSVAILKTSSIKLAELQHISALYAPCVPKAIIESLEDVQIDIKEDTKIEIIKDNEEENIIFDATILVAEDNKTNQILISLMLDDLEIDYDIANDGVEAVKMFKNKEYNLVLMDENMPNLNGIGAMQQIKEYEKEHSLISTPIIALTASVLDTDKEMFLRVGMDGFVGKPIDTKDLTNELNKFL